MRPTAVTSHQMARIMINADTNNIDMDNRDIDSGEVSRGFGSIGRDMMETITPQTPVRKNEKNYYFLNNLPVEVTK